MAAAGSHPWTALHVAADAGDLSKVQECLAAGADINALGHCEEYGSEVTPLWIAVDKGKHDVVKFLISKGANINTPKANTGTSPLLAAMVNSDREMFTILIEAGADPSLKRTDSGMSPFLMALDMEDREYAIPMLEHGKPDCTVTTEAGYSIVHMLVDTGARVIAPLMAKAIAQGADVTRPHPKNGKSPLWAAVNQLHTADTVRAILSASKADLEKRFGEKDTTPFLEAADGNLADVLEVLKEAGADMTARDSDGKTALMRQKARSYPEQETLDWLVANNVPEA